MRQGSHVRHDPEQYAKYEWQRKASEKLAVHDIGGLKDYHEHGHVHMADTIKDAQIKIVDMWSADRAEHPGQSRIVLAHTNTSRRELNDMMRAELKREGRLEDEIDVVTPRGVMQMAVGEQVMFTVPNSKLRVKNGTSGTVLEIDNGMVKVALPDGSTTEFKADGSDTKKGRGTAVDYGYAVTIHKSQGMTLDKAFVLAENSMTLELLYVALTRHKMGVELVGSAEQFATVEELIRGLDRTGNKTFSVEDGKEWLSAQRPEDSKIGQLIADINAEKGMKLAAEQAKYKEIAANLDAQRVLDHVSKSHGVDIALHEVITDQQGRQRIQVNKLVKDAEGRERIEAVGSSHDAAAYLTKVMHLDYKTQAAPILRQCYGEQLVGAYSTPRREAGQGIDQQLKNEFADYRKVREATYKADKEFLDQEKRTEKTRLARSGSTVKEYKTAYAELSKRIKADKSALKALHERPEAEAYKDFLAERAANSERHLKELWRVATSPADKARLDAIEKERAAVRELARAGAEKAIAGASERVAKAAERADLAKAGKAAGVEVGGKASGKAVEATKDAEVTKASARAAEVAKAPEKAPEVPRKDKDHDMDHGL
jgi:hypothetical protein